jgi:hypothetical protein
MDETPEELEQIRAEAAAIDVQRYRKRRRAMMAAIISLAGAGVCWLAVTMADAGRNPCQRVRDHFCGPKATDGEKCRNYHGILKESVEDPSPAMRSMIREQCLTKINRMKEEDNIVVP